MITFDIFSSPMFVLLASLIVAYGSGVAIAFHVWGKQSLSAVRTRSKTEMVENKIAATESAIERLSSLLEAREETELDASVPSPSVPTR